MPVSSERSAQACPVCGAHQLALIDFPEISTVGYQPYSDIIGMGEAQERNEPGIGCLACGAGWSSLRAFKEGAAAATMADESTADESIAGEPDSQGPGDGIGADELADREAGHPA